MWIFVILRAMAEDFTLSGFEQMRGAGGEGVSKERQRDLIYHLNLSLLLQRGEQVERARVNVETPVRRQRQRKMVA